MRLRFVAPFAAAIVLATAPEARAGATWGDASLTRDDVRIELAPDGHAEVTHAIGLHVAGKKFKAFLVDGVDEGLEPPTDDATQAGLDGPGWPVVATDAKGAAIEAFVEPTKEARKLRVRLGLEGVPRGDYAVQLRYRVDLSKRAAFTRDGAMLRFGWTAPRWSEGYDAAKIVVALPSSKAEPRVSIADPGGDGEHDPEGVALVAVHAGSGAAGAFDEIEIARPHVPALDDTRWIFRVDAKALPTIAASLGADPSSEPTSAGRTSDRRRQAMVGGIAAILALGLGALLRLRDRGASQAASALGTSYRPLLPVGDGPRAAGYALASAAAVAATWTGRPLVAGGAVLAGMAFAILRAPIPRHATRGPGSWLAVPRASLASPPGRVAWRLDPTGRTGAVVAAAIAVLATAAIAVLARREPRAAAGLAIDLAMLLPLLLTGRGAQLPKDRVTDAWRVLAPIDAALESLAGARTKVVARTGPSGTDELRLRVEPKPRGGAVRAIEIGCALAHTAAGTALVPELLVRMDAEAEPLPIVDDGATCVACAGRTDDERVLAIRPADTSPRALLRWTAWALGDDARDARRAPAIPPTRAASRREALTAETRGA